MQNELSKESRSILADLPEDSREKLSGDGSDNTEFGRYAASLAMYWHRAGGSEESFIEAVSASHLGQTYYRPNRLEGQLSGRFAWAEENFDPSYSVGEVRERLADLRRLLEASDLNPSLRASAVAVVDRRHDDHLQDRT